MSAGNGGGTVRPLRRTNPMRRRTATAVRLAWGLVAFGPPMLASSAAEHADAGKVDFARQILPVLSDKCFVCHGPDSQKAGSLRLDTYELATLDRGGYRAIDPEQPAQSEVLLRIKDPGDPMPPEDAEKKLTPEEIALIERWILEGGEYAMHWAFVPPRKGSPPRPAESPAEVIDAFVLDRLAQEGLEIAPEADRATLARRVALTLTGLPPEPEPLARFLEDDRPEAYAAFVDGILASPRYGEHQARFWLDAVRYGDTHGLHLDNRRGIYPYRDYVVRAFNRNQPLDEFILWQLAGDLLPEPTLEQRVATGFVRMNPSTAEGGVLPEEFQAKNSFDRTETVGTVFLGMTLSCARCHTHKYDPITQTEYYRLLAFFNNTAENPLDGNAYEYAPVVEVPADQAAWREWEALAAARDALIDDFRLRGPERLDVLRKHAAAAGSLVANGWMISPAEPNAATEAGSEAIAGELEPVEGLPGTLKRKLPKEGDPVALRFRIESGAGQLLRLTFSGGPGSELQLDGETIPLLAGSGDRASTQTAFLTLAPGPHDLQLAMAVSAAEPSVEVRLHDPWRSLAAAGDWDACAADERLWMLADPYGPLAELVAEDLALDLARRLEEAKLGFTTTLVARELDQRRPTHLLRRGEYDLPEGEPLAPDVPGVMGAFPPELPRDRLGLARWLISPQHPLTARVLVNRIWQSAFGEGLVRSPEDFGLQGQQPTHPELLDWLAVELQDSGWDMKHMLRAMVTSRTFRQHSGWRDDVDDPPNRLLARGPSYRLDAEVLRDLGLWASGLLDPHMGGEGVKPYQPSGMWFAMAHPASNTKRYVRDTGRRLYRRSLYVYWKRTSPHPMMTLFDAPSREVSCVRRSRTSTSLQSLGLLNETQRIEMARELAERLLEAEASDPARLDRLFQWLTCRSPNETEHRACHALIESLRARYAQAPDEAEALLSIGDAERPSDLDPAEHAAWTQVAVTLLASDAVITLY